MKPIPSSLAAIAGDAVFDLRSALDHLAYQLFMIGTGGVTIDRRIEFPIADNAKELKDSVFRRKIKGIRPEAVKAIDDAEPYKAGKSDALWRLHTLNIIDEHRFLNLLVSRHRSTDLAAHSIRELERMTGRELPKLQAFFFLADAERLRALQLGDQLLIDRADAEVNEKMEFRFEIAFGEPQVVEGKSVVETLQHMADAVDRLIISFKPLLV